MRNIFAHNYHNIDYDAAWNTILYDIPILKSNCETIILERQQEQREITSENILDDDNHNL